jgi:hypothetical protein
MEFVKLTCRGSPVYFNPQRIATIRMQGDETFIHFSGIEADYWMVDQTAEQVAAMLADDVS